MRMGFSWTFFIAISFCLILISVQGFDGLVVVRYPPSGNGTTRKLTCLSEDDDSALIWNYNPETNGDHSHIESFTISEFQPGRWIPQSNPKCLVWNSTDCLAKWHHGDNWNTTKSASRPMSPVFDYRWEGFGEYVFKNSTEKQEIIYVAKVDGSSGTTAFSARGSSDVYVYLCETKKVSGRCLWIILGGWMGMKSAIRSCANGASALGELSNNKTCTDVASVEHTDTGIIDPYEWRTFRLEWNGEPATIKVFRKNDPQPFLSGTLPKWYNVPRVFVRSGTPSRIRFHFYKYYFADQENAKLYTGRFGLLGDNFCANLLVGLCPECELSIAMVEINGNTIETWTFSGDEDSMHNQLLDWQSVKLNTTWPNSDSRVVQLVIETISNAEDGKGQWAIDSFRMCEPSDGIRESTITIQENAEPKVKCQKLSYTKSALVTSVSKTTMIDTTHLQRFLSRRKGSCGSKCASFGSKSLICDQTGCTCDRGFMESNCSTECSSLSYGYNCQDRCGKCDTIGCNRKTGYCRNGCDTYGFLAPRCESDFRTQKPTVTNITDTTAQVLQTLDFEPDAEHPGFFYITEVESSQNTIIIPVQGRRPSTFESDVQNLKPSTRYKVHTTVTWPLKYGYGGANSSETIFTTTCTGKPRFEISAAQTELTITMPQRDKMCGDSADPNYYIRVFTEPGGTDYRCNENVKKLPYMCKNLETSTDYNVSITQSNTPTFSRIVRTLEPAPSEPRILRWFDRRNGIVTLKWMHPLLSGTKIKKFRIDVKLVETKLQVYPSTDTVMPIEILIKHETKYYSSRLHLFPSTTYDVTVMAVTANDINSTESKAEISVSGSIGFKSGEEPHVSQSGTLIELLVPAIENVTKNTQVSVFVRELTTCPLDHAKLSSFANNRKWLAVEYKQDQNKPRYSTIDTEQNQDFASNCPLPLRATYEITVIVKDLYSNTWIQSTLPSITLVKREQNLAWLAIFPVLIAICVTVLFVWHRIRKRAPSTFVATEEVKPIVPSRASYLLIMPPSGSRQSVHLYTMPNKPDSGTVSMTDFGEYAKKAIASGWLYPQFMQLPKGMMKSCRYGGLPKNISKNRCGNQIAYDNTRMILEKIHGDSCSDYINASYIPGYKKERAYIATQGPLPNTMNDFWRMIWQVEVRVICMLTNVIENTEIKCEKYWPDVGTSVEYGDFIVSNTNHQVFADYTIRTFELSRERKTRKVQHLHYTGWPSHTMPTNPEALVRYLKRLQQTPVGNAPVVIHGSTGEGRTSTVILSDICIRRAIAEGVIDVPAEVEGIRDSRANMMGSLQLYLLAHIIIAEAVVSLSTQIPCAEVSSDRMKKMRINLPSDIQRLNESIWQKEALHSLVTLKPPTVGNGVYEEIPEYVPVRSVEGNSSSFDIEGNTVGAVSVDGVKVKKQYLTCAIPSPLVLPIFWKFITDKNIELVVILQCSDPMNPTCSDIMPDQSISFSLPQIQVENKTSLDEGKFLTNESLSLTYTLEGTSRTQAITVLNCKGWGCGGNGKPPPPSDLVSLWKFAAKIPRNGGQSLVLCHDGIFGCGLYLAMSFLLERMVEEGECDVISAVRAVRQSRPEFVQSREQFEYLYDAAVNHVERFQIYDDILMVE